MPIPEPAAGRAPHEREVPIPADHQPATDEVFLKKHPRDAFDFVNQVFTWGEDDYQFWQRSDIALDGKVFTTGNPRIDTMRREVRPFFAREVAEIQARYGDYVLLNTNFPTVNNLTPQGGSVRLAKWALDPRGKQMEQDFLGNKRAMYEKVLEIAPRLAEATAPVTLLIRPHPNEDHEPWKRAVAGVANAQAVFEGGVVPWIIGARALSLHRFDGMRSVTLADNLFTIR